MGVGQGLACESDPAKIFSHESSDMNSIECGRVKVVDTCDEYSFLKNACSIH